MSTSGRRGKLYYGDDSSLSQSSTGVLEEFTGIEGQNGKNMCLGSCPMVDALSRVNNWIVRAISLECRISGMFGMPYKLHHQLGVNSLFCLFQLRTFSNLPICALSITYKLHENLYTVYSYMPWVIYS